MKKLINLLLFVVVIGQNTVISLLIICSCYCFVLPAQATNDTVFVYNISNEPKCAIQAVTEFYSGNFDKAYALINEAIKLQPNSARFYNTRALIKTALKDYTGAFEDYAYSIFLETDYPTPYYNRANLLRDLGYYEKAIADYNTAIALNYDGDGAYINRGFIKLEHLQDIEGAFSDFDTAIKMGFENEGAYYGRAVCNYHKQFYNNTISDATKAILLQYRNPDAYLIRAQAKIQLKQIPSGLQDLEWAEQQYNMLGDKAGARRAKNLYIYYFKRTY